MLVWNFEAECFGVDKKTWDKISDTFEPLARKHDCRYWTQSGETYEGRWSGLSRVVFGCRLKRNAERARKEAVRKYKKCNVSKKIF